MNKREDTLYDVDYFKHTTNNHTCGDKTGVSQPQRFLSELWQRVAAVSELGRGGCVRCSMSDVVGDIGKPYICLQMEMIQGSCNSIRIAHHGNEM